MKITKITGYQIELPLKEPFVINYASYPHMPAFILAIETDEGITGYGEAVPDEHVNGEHVNAAFEIMQHVIAPALINRNPLNINAILDSLDSLIIHNPSIKAAVDIALHDILGKKAGLPLYELLGGKTKDRLSYAKVLSVKPFEQLKNDIDVLLEQGYNVIKVKLGGDVVSDCRKLQQILDYVDESIEVRVDCNQAWSSPKRIAQMVNQLDYPNLMWIEQPLSYKEIEGLNYLYNHMKVPLMVDESILNVKQLVQLNINTDLINVKLMKCGGIKAAIHIINYAEAHDIPCQIGSMVESSIGSAAGYHVAMSHHNVQSTELTGPLLFSEEIGNLKYEIPYVYLNDAPGLGIEIDQQSLNAITTRQFEMSEINE
ncbi:mandelate racemase/muconate lactonizing enzyme family protein [Macrococcus sp. CCM 2573]